MCRGRGGVERATLVSALGFAMNEVRPLPFPAGRARCVDRRRRSARDGKVTMVAAVCALLGVRCDGGDCSTESRPGVFLRVEAPGRANCGATVTIQDGSYIETLEADPISSGECAYGGAFERPGTYTVTVKAAGFRTATETIAVPTNACHVETQNVDIRLEPESASDAGSDAAVD
jgi:hypothetical protein